MTDFLIDFLLIFGRFLIDFWAQVSPQIDPKSIKNRTKIGIENIAKKMVETNHGRIAVHARRGLGRPLKETRNWSTRDREPETRDQS